MSEQERLSDTLTQDTVYVASRNAGGTGLVHLRQDCGYLQQKNVSMLEKPASAYPVGYFEVCTVCGDSDE